MSYKTKLSPRDIALGSAAFCTHCVRSDHVCLDCVTDAIKIAIGQERRLLQEVIAAGGSLKDYLDASKGKTNGREIAPSRPS